MTLAEQIAQLSPGRRRALALLMLATAVVVLWQGVFTTLQWTVASQEEWRTDIRRELARDRGKVAIGPALNKQLTDLAAAPIWRAFYDVAPHEDATGLIQRDVTALGAQVSVVVQAVT